MKRIISLVLILIVICLCFAGCTEDNKGNTDTSGTVADTVPVGIDRTEALEIAKQRTVNHFCAEEGVKKLSISYGTEDVTKKENGGWEVHLMGYYYPIDRFGNYGDRTTFAYTVHMDSEGVVQSTFDY